MKIEIGESLAYSWLKHVKCCQIVQLNWKIADEWDKFNTGKLTTMLEKAKEYFNVDTDENEDSDEKSNIFKKNANLEQIVRQSESDVLGIHLNIDEKIEVYAVEVAFHSQGLNYTGGKQASKSKIIAKAIKSAMGIYSILGANKANICFMSPKVNPATLDILNDVEDEINRYFCSVGLEYKFTTYFNEKFSNEVWLPICKIVSSNGANDTSELCARAMALQLLTEASSVKASAIAKKSCSRLDMTVESPIHTLTVIDEDAPIDKKFMSWLLYESHKKESVAKQYSLALKAKRMLGYCNRIGFNGFYTLNSSEEARDYRKKLMNIADFRQYNTQLGGTPSAAMERYADFLEAQGK